MLQIKTVIIHKCLREVYDIVIRLYSKGYNVYTWDKSNDTFIKFKGGIRVCKIEQVLSTKKMTLLDKTQILYLLGKVPLQRKRMNWKDVIKNSKMLILN